MKVLCLLGPTASGKTSLAIKLANKCNVEIISVDSAMIYKGLDIGTGKPDKKTLVETPHRLVDILDPVESYSVGDFVRDVEIHIQEILNKGNVPLLVGGTMMYFNSLYNGIGKMPASDLKIRSEIESKLEKNGLKSLYSELKLIDPISAEKININDPQRIIRALEVFYISGKPISNFMNDNDSLLKNYEFTSLVVSPSDRTKVHNNIKLRLNEMLEMGFIDEVKLLFNRGDLSLNNSSIRSVGYKQIWQYLSSEITYQEMFEQTLAATRQLAKRQFTWLRKLEKQFLFHNLDSDDSKLLSQAIKLFRL